jgi:hypothetical protein
VWIRNVQGSVTHGDITAQSCPYQYGSLSRPTQPESGRCESLPREDIEIARQSRAVLLEITR